MPRILLPAALACFALAHAAPDPASHPNVIASQKGTLAALHGDWKLIQDHEGEAELFNVKTDPGEKTNLADQQKDRVEKLKTSLASFAEMLKSRPALRPRR